jgi:hypothetical protein
MTGKGLSKVYHCCYSTLRNTTAIQRRPFSTSIVCLRHGTDATGASLNSKTKCCVGSVPAFTKTSSPELDDLLSNIRKKIFLPSHLSQQQKDVIYRKKHQKMLTTEPITAEIDGERFVLEHIDTTNVPATRKSLWTAATLMKEKQDWDNLPSLLIGFANAGRNLDWAAVRLTTMAGEASRLDVILECARRVSDTNFKLAPKVAVAFIYWALRRGIDSNWNVKETKQSLTWLEMISEMLEDPRHVGDRHSLREPKMSVEIEPVIAGALLKLTAIRATQNSDGKDEKTKITEYAARLLRTPWYFKEGNISDSAEVGMLPVLDTYLTTFVPVLAGAKAAQLVLDPSSELAVGLKSRADELEQELSSRRQALSINAHVIKGFRPRGLWLSDKLLDGSQSEAL